MEIDTSSYLFTEISPVSRAQQQVSYDHQLLPLGTEHRLRQFQHCLILQPEEKQTQPQLFCDCQGILKLGKYVN